VLTRTGLHAIRAMAVLGRLPAGEYAGAGRVAAEIGAPPNYLAKLLQGFARAGLVDSQKGVGGGFRLAKPPRTITLFDVVDPIEDFSRWSGCVLGRRECSDVNPCVVHERWKKIRADYLNLLQRTTIADLVKNGEPELLTAAG
jgi:Rrf2 family iron-sulfur cluster assembly transcriptional regulator